MTHAHHDTDYTLELLSAEGDPAVYSLRLVDEDEEPARWPSDATVSGWAGAPVKFIDRGDGLEAIYHAKVALDEESGEYPGGLSAEVEADIASSGGPFPYNE